MSDDRLILETQRLTIRKLDEDDAPFMLALLNDEAFIRFIGDRQVRTEEEARAYIRTGAMASYAEHGHGLYLVESRQLRVAIGTCGILRREALPDPDLGFAFAAEHRAKGYGREAASAVLQYAKNVLGIARIAAIVSPANEPSLRLLYSLGFLFERMVRMTEDEPEILYLTRELDGATRAGIAPPASGG